MHSIGVPAVHTETGVWLYHCQRTVYKRTDPEVGDLGVTAEGQQDIGWLYVSMYL